MGWIIALAILIGLAILPLGASVIYNADGAVIRILFGAVPIRIFPKKKKTAPKPKKEKKAKKEKLKKEKPAKTSASKPNEKKKGGSITDFFPFVELALDFLVDLRYIFRVRKLELKVILAGGDPADLAINYGKTWAALGNLWPRLETWFIIKKRDVEVECDFEGSATTVFARLDLTLTLGRVIALAVRFGIRGIKEFLKFRKKRNGGTAQ